MSLNIVDSLLDKLSFVSKDRNIPMGNKFTGSQSFLGTNSYGLSQSIPSEFTRAFMDPDYITQAHNRMNRSSSLDSKMNYFHYFEQSNDRLVSRVSKLLSPVFTSHDCFRGLPSVDIFQDQEFFNRGVKVFYDEIEQHIDMLSQMLIPNEIFMGNTSKAPPLPVKNPGKESNSDSKSVCPSPNTSNVEIPSNETNVLNSQTNSVQITCHQPKSSADFSSNHLKGTNSKSKTDMATCQTNIPPVKIPSKEVVQQSVRTTLPVVKVQKNMAKSSTDIPSNHLKGTNSQSKTDMANCQTNISPVKIPSKEAVQESVRTALPIVKVQKNMTQLKNNNQAMNKELTNRKNKELQKRSKKRRRRQKKVNVVLDKETLKVDKTPQAEIKIQTNTPKAESKIQANSPKNKSSDILCDITIADSASSVQILLPNASSFVISIESAEDDSDWDSGSDCEWLNDCSEFELSGIFISNLSTPLASTFSKSYFSRPCAPPSHAEEAEMRSLGAVLRKVNRDWIKSTKGLDTKPKVATKVSFAPDDELVEVLHVDIYERKGEWETYATERMRFKRRITELEKIISPCLSKEHRDKIFFKFHDSNL